MLETGGTFFLGPMLSRPSRGIFLSLCIERPSLKKKKKNLISAVICSSPSSVEGLGLSVPSAVCGFLAFGLFCVIPFHVDLSVLRFVFLFFL